tara:strand:+ start:3639 stop:5771 length:2133 start_codon:yes stop_codon:yes gene_type:complete
MNKFLITLFIIFIFFRQILFLNADNDTYINTTNITYNEVDEVVELANNSKININNTNILVDRGIIDYKNDKIEIFGNFYLYQDLNILSGKDLLGNTDLNNFSAIDVSYIYNNDLKIDSEKSKRSNNIIYFYNNFLTPCEIDGYFGCPTWSLRIDETKYNIEKDKFVHFDTFLQIADYKLFYIPYFSHYGAKAQRQRGFLTPLLEFSIGGDSSIYTPYYIPLRENIDIKLTPKFSLDFSNNYSLNTRLNHKTSGGTFALTLDTIKYENNDNLKSSARFDLRQVLDKNRIIYFEGLVTNSISTTRSLNEKPLKFEKIYLRLDNYDFFLENDYLSGEISTVEAFDSTNISLIPFTPIIKYQNNINLNENISNYNEINFTIIKRDESQNNLASESGSFKVNNYLSFNNVLKNVNIFNKLSLLNGLNNYTFEHNSDLNSSSSFNHLILSSDLYLNSNEIIKPRVKLIYNQDIYHSDNIFNEDSNSITFNYQNSFSDNRFFGTDDRENTSRIVYGFESELSLKNQKVNINTSQSYDFKKENNFSNRLNQSSYFSDFAIEANTTYKKLNLNLDTRLDRSSLENKELNLELNLNDPVNITLNYHETSKNAFSEKSNDTEYLGLGLEKKINNNISLSYGSNIDLKNNFSPYYDSLNLKIFDECSELNIVYSNRRYNDNYNTSPEELLSISFYMDYLGFFGYEQTTDLFFQETGSFNYGL